MGRYTEASKLLDAKCVVSNQLERGWANIYDVLVDEIKDKVENACEIGIGFGNSLVIWKYIFGEDSHVLGLDVACPDVILNENAGCNDIQYRNQLESVRMLSRTRLKYTKNIQFGWNRDGYNKEVVEQAAAAYGQFQWVVNDGKQRGENWSWMEPWKNIVTEGGIIFQEKLGREVEGISGHNVQASIDNGWLVYDCRSFAEIGEMWSESEAEWDNSARLHGECFLGIWSRDQEYIKSKLAHLEEYRVTGLDYIKRTTPEKYIV